MKRWLAGIMVLSLLLLASTIEARTNTSDASNRAIGTGIPEPISLAGSRYVWEEGMEPVFNLTPLNFDIFYYDIDSGAGGEIMNIDIGDPSERTIQLDKLTYDTSAFNISFRYRQFGSYSAIGFLGEKYLAAYTNDSKIALNPVNLLGRKILSKVLIDENKNHSLVEGKNLTLGADYVLRVKDVNITSKTAVISIINRNEIEVYHRIVNPGYIVVYEKAVDKVHSVYGYQKDTRKDFPDFLPIIAFHVDSIIVEDGNAAVAIDGIFQLSDVYTDIDPEYGLLGITEVSGTGIAMKNRMKAGLTISNNMNFVNIQGTDISQIYFIGNIRLKLANSKTLRFFAYDENMPPNHERRGSVYSGSSPVQAWDGLNFPGFLYYIDSNSFSEKLEIINISGRKIPKGYLRYDIAGVNIPLKVAGIKGSEEYGLNASFMVFGIGTEKYIAANKSTELSKILIEHTDSPYDKKLFAQGDVWELGEGYNLTLKTLEVRVDPRRALLSFSHNGDVLKESWVRSGGIFSYSENVSSGQIEAPKFFTYVDAIFTGCCFDFAQLRYTFLTSDNITRIHKGDRIGAFRVIDVEPDFISMENDIDIYLRPGNHPNLVGNLSFRVADANELRFYPSNTKGQEISEENEEVPETDSSKNMNLVEDNTGTNPSGKNTSAPENAVQKPAPSFEFYIAALSIIILFLLKTNRK